MAKQASKTVIGVFVVSSIAMLIAGVIIFGSGDLFKKTNKFVMFFESSVKGLSVGAPVIWHGVKVGSVSSIVLKTDPKKSTINIPVVIEVDPNRMEVEGERSKDLGASLKRLIGKGLRARLALESIVTGASMIEVEFLPGTPVHLTGLDSRYPEIPTVKTSMKKLAQKLLDLPIEKIAGKLVDILDNLDKVIADPEIKEMVHNLNVAIKKLDQVLENTDKLVLDADGELKELRGNLNNKLDTLSDGMQTTMADARKAMVQAKSTLVTVDGFIGERSDTRHKLNRTLDEFSAAAKSLKSLMDYLERHPESLLQGKGGRGR